MANYSLGTITLDDENEEKILNGMKEIIPMNDGEDVECYLRRIAKDCLSDIAREGMESIAKKQLPNSAIDPNINIS